ncbi:hypothetical protein BY996DRAFT_6501338 [Phakopsora pachyrhizi]|nr:hypothetical protein BY996DRAFT_6501338 [Phakopsora pachyrhizi]
MEYLKESSTLDCSRGPTNKSSKFTEVCIAKNPNQPNAPESFVSISAAERCWLMTKRGQASRMEDESVDCLHEIEDQPMAISIPALICAPDKMWNWFEIGKNAHEDLLFKILNSEMVVCSLTALPFAAQSTRKQKNKKRKNVNSSSNRASSGLARSIKQNAKTLWEIKKVHQKNSDLVIGNYNNVSFYSLKIECLGAML